MHNAINVFLLQLADNPDQAVADLLSGHLDRGQFARLDPAAFVLRTLAETGSDALRPKLDMGVLVWLNDAMARDEELRTSRGLNAHLYEIGEALTTVSLADLSACRADLVERMTDYQTWLRPYETEYGDNLYATYWRTLAATETPGGDGLRKIWEGMVGCPRHPWMVHVGKSGLRHQGLIE